MYSFMHNTASSYIHRTKLTMPMSDIVQYVRTQYEEKARPREEIGPGHRKVSVYISVRQMSVSMSVFTL